MNARGEPTARAGGSVSVKEAWARGASCNVAATEQGGALVSLRQTRTVMLPLSKTLSVVFVGMVQVSATWGPVRSAERSATGTGRLSDGGRGAPGMPQPPSATADANAAVNAARCVMNRRCRHRFLTDCMALSV